MAGWPQGDLKAVAEAPELHVAPLRDDAVTYRAPTRVWVVAVDDGVYVRAYNGQTSRWFQAAIRNGAGRIILGDMTRAVAFVKIEGDLNERIDDAYRRKYGRSSYLDAMIGARARATTLQVVPRD